VMGSERWNQRGKTHVVSNTDKHVKERLFCVLIHVVGMNVNGMSGIVCDGPPVLEQL
jgi:hypothetical protein